ncbi:MAG: RNA polymerase factor sigma-54 [Gammaproteobacteria bacterium]
MKQSLQLKLGQQLTMTPQLQQAIRLLQLSSMELSLEVQQALDSNMMLELEDDSDLPDLGLDGVAPATTPAATEEFEGPDEGFGGEGEDWETSAPSTTDDIPEEMPVDSDWEEVFDSTLPQGAPAGPHDEGGERENQAGAEESLRDHLLWQLNLLPLGDTDRRIGVAIIDAVNDDGYLETTLEELLEIVSDPGQEPILLEEVAAMLKQIQTMEPVGVAARDLKECLLIQLRQRDPATPWRPEAIRLCEGYLDLLAGRDYNQLMRRLKLTQDELRAVIALVQSLSPRPGSAYATAMTEYLVPDVFVRKIKGRWKVELNPDSIPHVRINPYYASMVRRVENGQDSSALRTHLQEAKWFIKSLQSRSETLLRVASAIVERQRAFLEHGEEAMRPLVLHDIAEALGMHESTISRVTTRKYMHTPRGTFELKYFFSSHVGTALGGEASSTAIRAVIRKLIAAESSCKPLSDSKIASILMKQGVNVARRTVAKYREGMQIPPSNERKKLA